MLSRGFVGEPERNLTMVTLLSKDYEPEDAIRVDSLPKGPSALSNAEETLIYKAIEAALSGYKTILLGEVKQIIQEKGLGSWSNDDELNDLLRQNGWSIIYTFQGL